MMIYATFNESGLPTAFYRSDINGNDIPEAAVEITEGQWIELISHAGYRCFDVVAGTVIQYTPAPTAPPVPQKITRAQGRLVLYRAGLWPAVLTFVAGIADPDEQFEADAALNHTTEWERSSPFLCRTAQALGLDDEQLDGLFIEAAKIVP